MECVRKKEYIYKICRCNKYVYVCLGGILLNLYVFIIAFVDPI